MRLENKARGSRVEVYTAAVIAAICEGLAFEQAEKRKEEEQAILYWADANEEEDAAASLRLHSLHCVVGASYRADERLSSLRTERKKEEALSPSPPFAKASSSSWSVSPSSSS